MSRRKSKELFCTALIPATLLGNVNIAVTKHGLISINFDQTHAAFINQIRRARKLRHTDSDAVLSELIETAVTQISNYLLDEHDNMQLPVDLGSLKSFQRSVLEKIMDIKRGQIVTYGDVAKMLSKPGAARAVGQALRRNPIPIVIPCHRVISADGTLGGYGGRMGGARKRRLLRLEGAILI